MAELVYPPVIAAVKAAFRVLDLRWTVSGGERVPRHGGAVLACNHVSYLDFIFAGLAAQPSGRLVRFMAKESVFRHPVAGPLMRGMHHIPVDRGAGSTAYRLGLSALRAGEVVGVFPEGTISRSFRLKEFKPGAIRMARGAGVPVIPVVTWGGQRLLTKGHPPRLRRHLPISVRVGEPLTVPRGGDPDAAHAELQARMAALLDAAQRDYPDRPTSAADGWWQPRHLGGTAPTLEEAAALDAGGPAPAPRG